MRSMTGFGHSAGTSNNHQIDVTLRSVNSRYLDLSIKVRDEFRDRESAVRNQIEKELLRGRVDVSIEVRSLRPRSAHVEIQTEVVRALHRVGHEMAQKGFLSSELSLGDLLRMPEVIEVRVEPDALSEEGQQLLHDQLELALSSLVAARETEGALLAAILTEKMEELQAVAHELRALSGEVVQRQQRRLEERLKALLVQVDLEATRLEQEVAILADKGDITEEIDRLDAHLDHFRSVIGSSGSIGKRMDFLSQEIQRELNTMGSKAKDAEITKWVLDGKVLCEQLREQVQNVE